MRHKAWQIAAVMAAAGALVFAGCGDDEESGGGGGGGGEEAAKGKVGVILPDAASSARWETADRTFLGEAFEAAGVEYDIQNANGDKAKFGTIADQMISGGVTVLMLVNLDSPSAATVINKARDQGIPSIDYDRLTLGGGADYYVSFDNVAVGTTIGEGLVQCMQDERRRLGSGRAAQRLADRQQRDAVQAGLREGDHGRRLRSQRGPGRARLGQHEGRHDLRADVHEGQRQLRGRRVGQRRPRRRGGGGAQAQRRHRQDPDHGPGRHDRGPAARAARLPVHDRLQGDQEGGRRRLQPRDLPDQRRPGRRRRAGERHRRGHGDRRAGQVGPARAAGHHARRTSRTSWPTASWPRRTSARPPP